ncbi:hypothetical protein BPOR_0527g00040 [Botrytis porri]|uniref:Uncharacterized protein n=1 Tax=Botrytis porri TaxID=87229 RepID=A0A4Z1KFH8_9HELO|nr:hypothetical protein BPOR_0527g00040 [Botrytis porri]
MELAKAYIDEEVLSRPPRAEQWRGFRTELLEAIKSNSRIEERAMVQAAEYLDERMFKLLLGLERDMKAISKPIRGDGKILIPLEERGMDSEMTEDMVQFISKNCGRNAMKSLIQKRRADVKITSELLKAVAKRREAVEQIDMLLDGRGADIYVDSGLWATVARMHYPHTLVMMHSILKKHGANIAIAEETIITAAGNILSESYSQNKGRIYVLQRKS